MRYIKVHLTMLKLDRRPFWHYTICDAKYTCSQTSWSLEQKTKKNYLEKNVLVIRSRNCGKMVKIERKGTLKKQLLKFGLSWGKSWLLRTLWRNLHMFLDIWSSEQKTKIIVQGKQFCKCGLINQPEKLVLSPESAKDL